jgi:hypothetical protein
MNSWHYILTIGFSVNGQTLHPSEADPEEGFQFPDLRAAMGEGERLAGRGLSWRHPAEGIWVAAVGDGRVADITRGAPVVGIGLSTGLMD